MARGVSREVISFPLWWQPKSRSRSGALQLRYFFISVLILIGFAFLFVWSRSEVVQVGYQISEARKQHERLLVRKTQLELERASLRDPRRIEEIATQMLGMQRPKPHQRIFLRRKEVS